jgi:circadian clock protein KaiC
VISKNLIVVRNYRTLIKLDNDILAKIASKQFEFDIHQIQVTPDKSVQGASGMEYKFDYIISSGNDMVAVKMGNAETSTNDIMLFNSQVMDAGINKKILITSSELGEYIKKMCNIYGIDIIDSRGIDTGQIESSRAKFGITILDAKLSGGLRPGYVYLISGNTGAGKTTLSSIFLSYGSSVGEKGLMILTDTFPDQFLDNIRTMNIGFADAYRERKIEVMEISDQIRSMKSEISSGKTDFRKFITKVVTELKKIIISKGIKRVVIDPVTLLLIPDDDFVNLFMNSLAIKGVTVLVTSGLRNSELSMFGIEEYYATGIIKLDYSLGDDGMSRMGKVVKMRGTVFDSTPFEFKITANGIEPVKNVKAVPKNQSYDDDNIFKNIR